MKNKLVHGVGINDADYNVYIYDENHKAIWRCPFYSRWCSILQRGYSADWHKKHPTYIGCTVVAEWLLFSNFKSWMETQDWEGKDLDKDILIPHNTVYGPDTCVFVDQRVNKFLLERVIIQRNLPVGVSLAFRKGRFIASCNSVVTGKKKNLGNFGCAQEAHRAWLTFKLEQAYVLAAEQTDERVAKALIDRYENYI